MIDQTAAFDLVDHTILVDKLAEYGLNFTALNWFKSYLQGRRFRVQIEARRSAPVTMGTYGVPQGSILESTLFIVDENDLPASSAPSTNEQTVAYVDDSTDQVSDASPTEVTQKVNVRADNVGLWLDDNVMIIAPDKTKL